MRAGFVVGIGLAVVIGGMLGGTVLGIWPGRRSTSPQELVRLAFSGEQARRAFERTATHAAWDVVERHRNRVQSEGACLGSTGQQLELMVTEARLVVLSRELRRPDVRPLTAALDACRKAAVRDCSAERVVSLAGRRVGNAGTKP